jgi:glyoxylate reductase
VPRVVATRPLLPRVEKALRESFAFESLRALDRAALAGADGLVTVPGDAVDAALLDAAGPQLRVVAQHAVGFDNVDLEAATERGVVVTNTPDVLTAATAEFTLALLLALVRRVAEGDRLVRARGPWSWEPTAMLGTGLAGKTLGLVGRGRIGGEVARLAGAFGMRVMHTSRSGGLPLVQLLPEADVVSLHVPLTAETRHLIDAAALERMGPRALLVNTSRGPVVDESALADALEAGTIAGAALDVFEHEPEVEPRLLSLPNVVLTPHVASATVETREAMGMLCVGALRAVLLERRAPENALNPEALS